VERKGKRKKKKKKQHPVYCYVDVKRQKERRKQQLNPMMLRLSRPEKKIKRGKKNYKGTRLVV